MIIDFAHLGFFTVHFVYNLSFDFKKVQKPLDILLIL